MVSAASKAKKGSSRSQVATKPVASKECSVKVYKLKPEEIADYLAKPGSNEPVSNSKSKVRPRTRTRPHKAHKSASAGHDKEIWTVSHIEPMVPPEILPSINKDAIDNESNQRKSKRLAKKRSQEEEKELEKSEFLSYFGLMDSNTAAIFTKTMNDPQRQASRWRDIRSLATKIFKKNQAEAIKGLKKRKAQFRRALKGKINPQGSKVLKESWSRALTSPPPKISTSLDEKTSEVETEVPLPPSPPSPVPTVSLSCPISPPASPSPSPSPSPVLSSSPISCPPSPPSTNSMNVSVIVWAPDSKADKSGYVVQLEKLDNVEDKSIILHAQVQDGITSFFPMDNSEVCRALPRTAQEKNEILEAFLSSAEPFDFVSPTSRLFIECITID